MIFAQNSSILHLAVNLPIAVYNLEVSQSGSNQSQKIYGFIYDAVLFTSTHAHKEFSKKVIIYSRSLN